MRSIYATPEAQFGTEGRLVLCRLVGPDTDVAMYEMVRVLSDELRDPAGRAVFIVVASTASVPTSVASSAVSQLVIQHGRRVLGSALTIEGSGFRAAAKRALAMSVRMLVKKTYPQGTFGDVGTASSWLAEQVPELSTKLVLGAYGRLIESAPAMLVRSAG